MITKTREAVWNMLADMSAPALLWLPGSAEELPCFVVGRPGVAESDQSRYLLTITTPVYVLGRVERDDDAQGELDAAADELLERLWQPRGTEGTSTRLTELVASTITVGNLDDLPAYTATVVTTTTFAC